MSRLPLGSVLVGVLLVGCNAAPGAATRTPGTGGASAGATGLAGGGGSTSAGGSTGAGGSGAGGDGGAGLASAGGAGAGTDPSVDASTPDAGGPETTVTPADAGAAEPIRALSVAVGRSFNCALLEDHSMKCWGANGSGQLGYGDTKNRGNSRAEMGDALPRIDLGTGRTATAISASRDHTCALLDDGSVKCWGEGASLGLADTTSRGTAPGQMGDALPALDLGAGRKATQIAAGYDWSCALLDDETGKCWGDKDLSDPKASHMLPTSVTLGTTTKVRSLVAGGKGAFLLLEDARLLGELPGPPVDWPNDANRVVAFGGAWESRCALFVGGGTFCRSAAGGPVPSTAPTLVAVGVGEETNACGILGDGSVRCWQLEPAAFWSDSSDLTGGAHVRIPGKVTAIASGGMQHMCALDADGRVWCWGNGGAALGASVGSTTVSNSDAWSAVDLGSRH